MRQDRSARSRSSVGDEQPTRIGQKLQGQGLEKQAPCQIIDWIHAAIDTQAAAIVINPARLTFASVPIMDALKMFPGVVIELHITNIHRREAVYQHSLMSKVATAVIAGLGPQGYRSAVEAACRMTAE